MADNDFAYRQEDAEKRRRRREAERQRRLRHAREEYIKKKNQKQSEWTYFTWLSINAGWFYNNNSFVSEMT